MRFYISALPKIFTNCGGALDLFSTAPILDELFPWENYSRHKFTFQMPIFPFGSDFKFV